MAVVDDLKRFSVALADELHQVLIGQHARITAVCHEGSLRRDPSIGSPIQDPARLVDGPFTGVVMALGAGFYEELAFRVLLFGRVC